MRATVQNRQNALFFIHCYTQSQETNGELTCNSGREEEAREKAKDG